MKEQALNDLKEFFRDHRSNESNYALLSRRMDEAAATDGELKTPWEEIRDKQGRTYEQKKEAAGTAWPEFEQFVTACERLLTAG